MKTPVVFHVKYGVAAYDAAYAGYGDDRSRNFDNAEDAIEYAKKQPANYKAVAWKQITMDPIHEKLWP
jgi:hypothetical protein